MKLYKYKTGYFTQFINSDNRVEVSLCNITKEEFIEFSMDSCRSSFELNLMEELLSKIVYSEMELSVV